MGFKFDHTNKWHVYNPESVLENKTHKAHWFGLVVQWHINFCRLFNAKGILLEEQ